MWARPPFRCFLLLFVLAARPLGGARAEDSACAGSFRPGQENFVVDLEDAVKEGAVLVAVVRAASMAECRAACCELRRCNVAQADANLTCALFDCAPRNKFACRFVRRPGYRSVIRDSEYRKYLQGPQDADEPAPPIAIAGQDVVVQPGATVTLDGIQSLALGDAHVVRYDWTLQSGEAVVVLETELAEQVRVSNLAAGRYRFRLTVTDSNERSHAASVQVLVLSAEMSARYCLAEAKVGPCRAAFPRWRYDAVEQRCQAFVFGGCKGNLNNFLSRDDCVKACGGVAVTSSELQRIALPAGEVCGSACVPGQLSCGDLCCLDATLECDGVTQCGDAADEKHCGQLNETFTRLLEIDVNQRKARCTEPPQTGPCRASLTRWYYNPLNTRCQRFTYGGCHGNDNNFAQETQCDASCHGVTERDVFARGTFERFEDKEEEGSNSGSVALAVILSVAVLTLLAVLAYCFLKKRKERSGGRADAGAAHRPASEQDTLVYNSTTEPLEHPRLQLAHMDAS
ncbi:kunitz-type protease inhibitor 1-like isoform X2 [Hippocampus comes]|uniref:kunitz-type protease inhibitor 1-like isoform X2 n=1 Tax=Hippocampus comes TaxID=109280 RepID=UPI00094E7D07|nr:PREDICTED: kunitz-type protease inhibitor 1-like isoform X2 [Hippocampus comes]